MKLVSSFNTAFIGVKFFGGRIALMLYSSSLLFKYSSSLSKAILISLSLGAPSAETDGDRFYINFDYVFLYFLPNSTFFTFSWP